MNFFWDKKGLENKIKELEKTVSKLKQDKKATERKYEDSKRELDEYIEENKIKTQEMRAIYDNEVANILELKDSDIALNETRTKQCIEDAARQEHDLIEIRQVATVLSTISHFPKITEALIQWLETKNEQGPIVLDKQKLKDLGIRLQLKPVNLGSKCSIELSKETLDKIRQHCKEYNEFHERNLIQNDKFADSLSKECAENRRCTADKATQKDVSGTIEVLDPLPSGATESFFKTLQLKLAEIEIELRRTDVATFNGDSNNSNLVMIVCNNHSRIQTDVTNTLLPINKTRFQRVFLVVIHCTTERSLPLLPSKSDLKRNSDFESIAEIVDFGFDNLGGQLRLYDCKTNRQALAKVIDFVKQERFTQAR